MYPAAYALTALTMATVPQVTSLSDSIAGVAAKGRTVTLASLVETHPDASRQALVSLAESWARSRTEAGQGRAAAPPYGGERDGSLAAAQRIAVLYAEVWNDSFPVRNLTRFASWDPVRRRAAMLIDSLRRAGH